MNRIPVRLMHKWITRSGEWIYKTKEVSTIGLTKHSVEQLNDIVYIEFLVEKNDFVREGDELAVIESVKATDTINSPWDTTILELNRDIETNLNRINEEPENKDNWLLQFTNPEPCYK